MGGSEYGVGGKGGGNNPPSRPPMLKSVVLQPGCCHERLLPPVFLGVFSASYGERELEPVKNVCRRIVIIRIVPMVPLRVDAQVRAGRDRGALRIGECEWLEDASAEKNYFL